MSSRNVFVLILFAISATGATLLCTSSRAQNQNDSTDSKIRSLLEQKRQVQQKRIDALSRGRSRADFSEEVFLARNDLLETELVLASEKDQRLAVLKQRVTNFQEYEDFFVARIARTNGNDRDKAVAGQCLVTSKRLDAEIDVLRLQESGK